MIHVAFGVSLFLAMASVSVAVAPPLDMPTPKFAPRPACICGTACVCKPGTCPGGCPVAASAPAYTMPGYDWKFVPGVGMAWVQRGVTFSPAGAPPVGRYTQPNCPGGVCPLPRR